ncbi:MAG: AarF/ABC1/UbiB kinase family protein [Chloroflexi bacterium]|nr:AarF/ABC1/UbiB kinase family protein [Chloroflexota bacterium]
MNRDSKLTNRRPKHMRHLGRYRQIAMILFKHRLAELIRVLGLRRFLRLRWLPSGNPWRKDAYSQSQHTRMALEELGTTFIKVGQILSTRTDILPGEFTRELAKLQNALRPVPTPVIEQVIDEELGRPIDEVFASFDPQPMGVASIGQAHAATLHDGTHVVVKTQKPGVADQVAEDVDILRHMSESATERWQYSRQYDLTRIVEEIAETLTAEMDYVREAHSIEHFAEFFRQDPSVHIPKVFWEYTTPRVITMERIRGVSILDLPALDKAGLDRKDLAKRCVNLWLKMVFEGDVFHADPHPGNLFVETDGRLGLIDFGMIGLVDDDVRDRLASSVKAILDHDVDLLVDSLIELGAVARPGSREKLRADLKHLMGHYPVAIPQLCLGANLGELFNVVRRNQVQLPDNAFMLLKTVSMAQSLGKGLDPDFDFFKLLSPNVEHILKEKYSLSAMARRFPGMAAEMALMGLELPRRVFRVARALDRGELNIRTDVPGLERHMVHLERIVTRMVIGLIAAAIILALALIYLGLRIVQ